MEFIQGAEKKIVTIDVSKPTAVNRAVVNVVGVFSNKIEVKEQKVTSIDDLTGVDTESYLYELVRAVFVGGGQEVVVYGKIGNFNDVFNSCNNEWFGTVIDSTDVSDIVTVSKEIAARDKMLFAQLSKGANLETVLNDVGEIAEDTTAIFYSKNDESQAAAVAGYTISKFPGSTMIADKLINGAVESGVTGAEQGLLEKANVNYVAKMKGQLGLFPGVTRSKDPIDFIHCTKALKFRLEEDFTALIKNTDKIGFDDLLPIKTTALTRCAQFENANALVEDKTTVILPKNDEIPANDKLNGILTGVIIECYYKYGAKELKAALKFKV